MKKNHPDALLLYQRGDFYELYAGDAKIAAEVLDLHLANTHLDEIQTEVCGFPTFRLGDNLTALRNAEYDVLLSFAEKPDPVTGKESRRNVLYASNLQQTAEMESDDSNELSEEELDELPISVTENGKVVTYPDAEALEEAQFAAEEATTGQEPTPQNFRITDTHLGEGGPKAKFRVNLEAITLLKELEADGQQATPEQQEVLSRYVGWGGLPDAFDESKEAWHTEYEQLLELLSPKEYESARASTLNAHYTSPTVIRAIYHAIEQMGFEKGRILEPAMGVGNFFGLLPESMSDSDLTGVELDSISGRIARQLYPKADITVGGFETTRWKDRFDLAIGNVPFGQYQVNDPAYNRLGFSIHNYFFAKTIDAVRTGGIIALLTSRYTMDSQDSAARRYIAQRADLLGAIRLPNNAFAANAGAEVVTDILFLQKRLYPTSEMPNWVQRQYADSDHVVNWYFANHPEMILGRLATKSTQYGRDDVTVLPLENIKLSELLDRAVTSIEGHYEPLPEAEWYESEQTPDTVPADSSIAPYSFGVVDDTIYYREQSSMSKVKKGKTALDRIRSMIEVRDCVHQLIQLELGRDCTAEQIERRQKRLNERYDAFQEKYGLISSDTNQELFEQDDSYYLISSLEILDEDKKFVRKADIFSKRTILPHEPVTHCDSAEEALGVSLGEHGKLDLPYIAELTGMEEEQATARLCMERAIYRNIDCPESPDEIPLSMRDILAYPLVTADEYLSGNVRKKLRMAKSLAEVVGDEQREMVRQNITALEGVQPDDLGAAEIEVHLGATWIEPKYVQQFMYETFQTPFRARDGRWVSESRSIRVEFSPRTGEWHITNKHSINYDDVNANSAFGTSRKNAYEILESSLNLKPIQVFDSIETPSGKPKPVLNSKETTLAVEKQEAIQRAFEDWIWAEPSRRRTLVDKYNQEVNCIRLRTYDGSHLVLAGISPEIVLRTHQQDAVARILYGGNTLLAHEVGAGKTFTMAAAAMEGKRLGLCSKSIFSVPNHLTQQWAVEFLRLYPNARLLVTTKKDFEMKNRKRFCARIATGDYDAIIIGHSQFEKIPLSKQRQKIFLQEQLNAVLDYISAAKQENSSNSRFSIKKLEKTKKSLLTKLEKLEANDKKDSVITFEELGCDRLFVDEAHSFKNLYLHTKLSNIAGLSTSKAQKSTDLFEKCRYLDELTGGKGVIFATGTPVSNSMTEIYTMQRYLQYDTLAGLNMDYFDSWASRFGSVTTAMELAPEGYNF